MSSLSAENVRYRIPQRWTGGWRLVCLPLPAYSSGPVEGTVNRIKMIKRQVYGRADLDRLLVGARNCAHGR
jgi:hypothetical protein